MCKLYNFCFILVPHKDVTRDEGTQNDDSTFKARCNTLVQSVNNGQCGTYVS